MKHPVKISIVLSVLVLVAAGILGSRDRLHLEALRGKHAELVLEASSLGILVDGESSGDGLLVTKRAREDRVAQARESARELVAFAKEMEKFKESGEQPDEATQVRITEMMERMLSLDADQIRILIAEFRASTEMEEETRTGMIVFAIMSLANDHPGAALAIFTESGDLLANGMVGKHVLKSSLENWARQDPDAALEWVRENGKKHPDLITDDVKAGLVMGAGANGMGLAFDLIRELGLKDSGSALHQLGQGVKTAEERTEFLNLLRDFSKGDSEGDNSGGRNAISSLTDGILKDGFETGSKWISDNKLTPTELSGIASMLGYVSEGTEKGRWIEWMGDNLPEDKRENQIENTVRNWTREDYRAAGEWLAAAPEGATKHAAVKSYAETVAKYDSATAAQWALTLPEGKGRTATLRNIHSNMADGTAGEKAAREAFKEKFGIK